MDKMFEQLWDKFLTTDISVELSIDYNYNQIKNRSLDTITNKIKTGELENALTLLIELFLTTPSWNPAATTAAINKLAEYLAASGKINDAIAFAEKGLQWDPCHPELLALIARLSVEKDAEKSMMYYLYLKEKSYPETLLEGYTPPEISKKIDPYAPKIDSIQKLSDSYIFRLMSFNSAALFKRPVSEAIDALRAHALACISGGHLQIALVTLRLALFRLQDPLYISGLNPISILTKKKWIKSLEAIVEAGLLKDSKAKFRFDGLSITEKYADRKNAIEEFIARKNSNALLSLVFDPVPELSFLSCKYLIELNQGKHVAEYLKNATDIDSKMIGVYGDFKPQSLFKLVQGSYTTPSPVVREPVAAAPVQKREIEPAIDAEEDEDETEQLELLPVKKKSVVKKAVTKKAPPEKAPEKEVKKKTAAAPVKKKVVKKVIKK